MPTPVLLEDRSGYLLLEDGSIALWGEEPYMTYTLFDLTYRVARELAETWEGVATSGSTTTIADTTERSEDDDYFNGGSAWLLRDAAGADAAPQGEYSIVTDFVKSTGTITLASTLTAAVGSGDRYAVARKHFPLNIIIQKINQSLQDLGTVPYTDTTSLTTSADQTEYTLPSAANRDLREVWLQTDSNDVDDNRWIKLYNWRIEESDPGVADTLVLAQQPASGYYLRLVYMANHTQLTQATDPLSENVPVELVVYPAVLSCLEWRKQRTGWDRWDDAITLWRTRVEEAKALYKVRMPRKQGRIVMPGAPRARGARADEDQVGTVRL